MRRGPGCPMISPRFLSSVSDMEEPGRGELCCSGKAHGEEWSGSEGGKARRFRDQRTWWRLRGQQTA